MARILVEIGTGKGSIILSHTSGFWRSSRRDISYEMLQGLCVEELAARAAHLRGLVSSFVTSQNLQEPVEEWLLVVTGKGRVGCTPAHFEALAQPPFRLVPLTLVQEAQHDIRSVFLATKNETLCPDLIAFLGSGTQTVGSERRAIAFEDGGASAIPTPQATSKYKDLVLGLLNEQPSCRLVLFSAGFAYGLLPSAAATGSGIDAEFDYQDASLLIDSRLEELFGSLRSLCFEARTELRQCKIGSKRFDSLSLFGRRKQFANAFLSESRSIVQIFKTMYCQFALSLESWQAGSSLCLITLVKGNVATIAPLGAGYGAGGFPGRPADAQ